MITPSSEDPLCAEALPAANNQPLDVQLRRLLDVLCVDLGFCIPPADAERIALSRHIEATDFAREVLKAEGFVPEYEKRSMRVIKGRFIERFGDSATAEDYEV